MAADQSPFQKNVERKVITGNEAFNEAMIQDPPSPWSKPMLLIYAFSILGSATDCLPCDHPRGALQTASRDAAHTRR